MTKVPTPTEMSKGQSDNINNATKNSIKQRLRTDLGRSVGVTTQRCWSNCPKIQKNLKQVYFLAL